MGEIKRRYFKAVGPEAEALVVELESARAKNSEAELGLARRFGAESVAAISRSGKIIGLGFAEPDAAREGFKRVETTDRKTGGSLVYFVPDRRFRVGKDAARAMEEFEPFTIRGFLLDFFKAHRLVLANNHFCESTAGYARDLTTILVAVPVSDGDEAPDRFDPPPMLVEIKKSEFITLTEE